MLEKNLQNVNIFDRWAYHIGDFERLLACISNVLDKFNQLSHLDDSNFFLRLKFGKNHG